MANPITQTYDIKAVRAEAVLTTGYVAGTVLSDCERYNQLMLFVDFTIGSLTRLELKVEYSFDGETYFQETFSAIAGANSVENLGIHKFEASGNYVLAIPIKAHLIKVSAKGVGTVTNSTLKIDAVVGVS